MIRSAREEAGMKIADLAERTGRSPSYLSKVERELRRPGTDLLTKLASILSLETDPLLCAAGHVPPDVKEILVREPGLSAEVREMASAR